MSTATNSGQRRPSKALQRLRDMRRTTLVRRIVQLAFAVFILVTAFKHQSEQASGAASVDALCPFGAVETLLTWMTTGTLITKIHTSNLVLGLAVLVAILLAGNAFCGWICPLGTVQDWLWKAARALHLPQWRPAERTDRVLRQGRFVVLGLVMLMSYLSGQLWFADYDPYVTIFGLRWLFEWNEVIAIAVGITALVLLGSLFVERLWCRYLCPLGAVFTVLGRFSFLRIRRNAEVCTDCELCDKPCPVGITVSKADPAVHPDCVGCLDCVAACPVRGALTVAPPVAVGALLKNSEQRTK